MSQTLPFGPATPVYPCFFTPTASYEFTIPSTDTLMSTIFNSGYAMRLKVQAASTVYVQHAMDGAMVKYVLAAGEDIIGPIQAVGGTSTGTTATTVVLEV